jgi:hypothetical protein
LLATADPGVIFTYPIDAQLDVPVGTRVVVTFSDPVEAGALGPCTATTGAFCVVGPNGPVAATPEVTGDGRSVQLASGLEPGTRYDVFVRAELSPTAANLPDSGPLFRLHHARIAPARAARRRSSRSTAPRRRRPTRSVRCSRPRRSGSVFSEPSIREP